MMSGNFYEAVVRTTDGTFRASPGLGGLVYVTEDGVSGLAGSMDVGLMSLSWANRDNCLQLLISWVYEMRRGLEILDATLEPK
jgi:hypothetical protein